MRITDILWKEYFVDKIESKHNVRIPEVEDLLLGQPHFRKMEKGKVKGEDVYAAYGQTTTGRYLAVYFIYKGDGLALPISARDLENTERRYYEKQK